MTLLDKVRQLILSGDATAARVVQRQRQQLQESIRRVRDETETFARAHGTAPKRLSTRSVGDDE